MRTLHANWFFVAVVSNGIVGTWGLVLASLRRRPNRWFFVAAGVGVVAMVLQVAWGLILFGQDARPADDFHLFYGYVILFTFAFAYIYRTQIERRPALAWGLLLLFVMGLGLRSWATVGG